MKTIHMIKNLRKLLLLTAVLTLAASPSFARVDLVAYEGIWTPTGGTPIPMWGFALDDGRDCSPATPHTWSVGPELTEANLQPNGNGRLRIRLRNCLSEPVSIIIPGQKAVVVGNVNQHPAPVKDGNRITSFTTVTPALDPLNQALSTVDYLWNNVATNEGTYLYMSGTHPAKQVQMGLYGSLKIGTYDVNWTDVTLLYSEIDPVLHNPPTAANPLNYKPQYFLVNGEEEVSLPAGDTTSPTVLSFLNAGLDFHVPTLTHGYMTLQAEDGNPYPFSKEQYSANLAAGKTIEAFWQPTQTGEHVIYDRRGNGMVAKLTVTGGAGSPVANNDSYPLDEDGSISADAALGLLANDTDLPTGAQAITVAGPSAGTLTLNPDGSFTYTPNADFNGTDTFTYKIDEIDGSPASNIATVSMVVAPVNDPPVAVADAYEAIIGVPLTIDAPGVLANDTDPDGDILTATGANINTDGSISFSSTVPGDHTLSYVACDPGLLCSPEATVTITVINDIPVAVDDTATVRRNSVIGQDSGNAVEDPDRNVFSLIANDTDANGINPATVVLTNAVGTTLITSHGTVVNNNDGTVGYTPNRRYTGTDSFTYTVMDQEGLVSNVATVRINVVRKRNLP